MLALIKKHTRIETGLAGLLLLLTSFSLFASEIQGVRTWSAPDNTRVVFDISEASKYEMFVLDNPSRVVIDFSNTKLSVSSKKLRNHRTPMLKRIRSAEKKGNKLRVVLDMTEKVRPQSFLLKPNKQYGHRLVVDLNRVGVKKQPAKSVVKEAPSGLRELVIAIDAGHGGEDPGALGKKGTREKDVALAIAKKLEKLVKEEPGMRPVMIRTGDYYISLRQRNRLAREAKADLFISIHADAIKNRHARGASVYALSGRGASSEAARWLAEKENAADLLGGVSLDDKDDVLASVLLDLSQTATIESSLDVGSVVLKELGKVGKLHKTRVEQAGFAVLKSPDVPSILIETAFISNTQEERKLRSYRHQQALATSIMRGVRKYFEATAPAGTFHAELDKRHTIEAGDTLSTLAERYSVSMNQIRSYNGLRSDFLKVGQVLKIPSSPTLTGG